jgi:hypothetical protein
MTVQKIYNFRVKKRNTSPLKTFEGSEIIYNKNVFTDYIFNF